MAIAANVLCCDSCGDVNHAESLPCAAHAQSKGYVIGLSVKNYLFVPTQNRESQQVPVYGDWKATVASIIEIHRCQGSRKQPEAAV